MVKILITGGAGFIGSSIAKKLLNKNYKIYLIDDLSTGNEFNIPKNNLVNFIKINVNNKKLLLNKFKNIKLDYIFHFAACVGVKRTLKTPLKVLDDIEGFKNIFYLAKLKKYGEGNGLAQNEEKTPLNSRLPYAIVKNIGEAFCKTFKAEHNINYTIFRLFNTYGPNQSEDFVIGKFIRMAIKNKNLYVYGDGKQSRTFCYIDDTIDSIINCFESKKYINNTVNIGNNKVINILQLAITIKKITKSNSNIIHLKPLKEGDMLRRKPDITKMKLLLNRNFTSLNNGLKKILQKYE